MVDFYLERLGWSREQHAAAAAAFGNEAYNLARLIAVTSRGEQEAQRIRVLNDEAERIAKVLTREAAHYGRLALGDRECAEVA